MMGNDNFVVKKRSTWVSVLKAVLIIAAIAFVAYKIYDKFFRKKVQQQVLGNTEQNDFLDEASESLPAVDVLEADASDVIVDAE